MKNRPSLLYRRRAARSGFTLVELLVVIAIIGILAAAAFPVITGQIVKAHESVAIQQAHNLTLGAFQYANDPSNNGYYPNPGGGSPAGAPTSDQAALALYQGKYVTDPNSFIIPGSGYSAATTVTSFAGYNSWAIVTGTALPLSSGDPDQLPLYLSANYNAAPTIAAAAGAATPITITLGKPAVGIDPFGGQGVAVGYKDQSTIFARAGYSGSTTTALVINAAAANSITATYPVSAPAGPATGGSSH